NRQAEAVAARARAGAGRGLILYTPVARRQDFQSAVAYLVRRLDENTAAQNFLAHLHRLADDPAVFEEERRRFEAAVASRHRPSTRPHRGRALPPTRPGAPVDGAGFANEADTDFAV